MVAGRLGREAAVMTFDGLISIGTEQGRELLAVGVVFAVLGLLLRRLPSRATVEETRVNAIIHVLDLLLITPVILLLTNGFHDLLPANPLAEAWAGADAALVAAAVLIIGDFIGYWRHRAQHSAQLWPAHAIHHSDRALSWFSLIRMHPIDRLGTAFDTIALAALGFPLWALALNGVARHYYGYLIHANLPWTFGAFDIVLNSPAMHRWHHSRDVHGKNFATLFSMWDRMFGTYYAPGPCEGPLGVDADMGKGAVGQYLYPLRVWGGELGILAPAKARDPQNPT